VFWPDDISLVASDDVDAERILTSAHVTDSYLLALAVVHDGRLATFDRRLSVGAVRGGKAALLVIPEA
jgi:predicted nucleic acid-binding protein